MHCIINKNHQAKIVSVIFSTICKPWNFHEIHQLLLSSGRFLDFSSSRIIVRLFWFALCLIVIKWLVWFRCTEESDWVSLRSTDWLSIRRTIAGIEIALRIETMVGTKIAILAKRLSFGECLRVGHSLRNGEPDHWDRRSSYETSDSNETQTLEDIVLSEGELRSKLWWNLWRNKYLETLSNDSNDSCDSNKI